MIKQLKSRTLMHFIHASSKTIFKIYSQKTGGLEEENL